MEEPFAPPVKVTVTANSVLALRLALLSHDNMSHPFLFFSPHVPLKLPIGYRGEGKAQVSLNTRWLTLTIACRPSMSTCQLPSTRLWIDVH